jgi:hypothetical protein
MVASKEGSFKTTVAAAGVVAVMTNVAVARSLAKSVINKFHTYSFKG